MFPIPTSFHSHIDVDIKELRRRIKVIKEKSIILRQSLKQDFKDSKRNLKDIKFKEKINCNFIYEDEVSAVEMCHKKVSGLAKTCKSMRRKDKLISKLCYKPKEITIKCSIAKNPEVVELEIPSISNVDEVELEIPSISNVNNVVELETPSICNVNKNSSIVKKRHSVKEKKRKNQYDLSDRQNEVEVIEHFANSDIVTTPIKNKILKEKKRKLYSSSFGKNVFPTNLNTVKSKSQLVPNNINLRNVNSMQYKSSDRNISELEVSAVEMCHKKVSGLAKTSKSLRRKDKLRSKSSYKPREITTKCSTANNTEVVKLEIPSISNVNEVMELESSSISNVNGVVQLEIPSTSNVNKSLKDSSMVKKQHPIKEKKGRNEHDLNDGQNEVEVIELCANSDIIITTPLKNIIGKEKKRNLHSSSVVENSFPLDLNMDKSKSQMVSNNINLKNVNNLQKYKSTKNSSTVSDLRKRSMSNKNVTSFENIDRDVIFLGDANHSSNVKKNEILANKNEIMHSKKDATNCRNEGNKKSFNCRKQYNMELRTSNDITVISDPSIREKVVSNISQTPNINLKRLDFSDIITITDDSNNKSDSNVTILQNFGNQVPEICIEESEEEVDNTEDIHIFNEKLKNPNEYVVPLLDFEEEPVDFPIPFLHTQGTISFSSKIIKEWESQGIFIKSGPWSKDEETLLNRNLRNFQSRFKVNNTRLLLGIGRQLPFFKNESSRIKRFLKAKHFYERLGKDLDDRILHCIYKKARSLFSPFTKRQCNKYSNSEVAQIIQMHKKYGKNWNLIGQISGLNPIVCSNIFSYYKKPRTTGKWSEKEIENLVLAIKSIAKTPDLIENWEKIAELIPSRNATQCNRFWTWNHKRLKEKYFLS